MHCCIPTLTTDSNTGMGMITLNMPIAECHEPSSGNFTLETAFWTYLKAESDRDSRLQTGKESDLSSAEKCESMSSR